MTKVNHESQLHPKILDWKAVAMRYHLIFDLPSGATASIRRAAWVKGSDLC
jgi:hypothetical protein